MCSNQICPSKFFFKVVMSQTPKSSSLFRALATHRFAKADSEPAEVRPRLYVGSIGAAENIQTLQKLGVSHILSLGDKDMFSLLISTKEAALTNLQVTISDKASEDLSMHVEACTEFIDEGLSKGGCLVHCFQGKSRSVGIVAAYLMKREGLTYERALETIRIVRPRGCPNIGFSLQLRKLEREWRGVADSSKEAPCKEDTATEGGAK